MAERAKRDDEDAQANQSQSPPRAGSPPDAKGRSGALLGAVVGLGILAASAAGAYKFFGEPSLSSTAWSMFLPHLSPKMPLL